MKVKLKCARGGHRFGNPDPKTGERPIIGVFSQEKGEVVEVPDDEGKRMCESGIASQEK